jgi:mono/diheme cytochrome c family protein
MGQVSVAITLLLVLFAAPLHAENQLERGRYLVETLAGCGNCHTPRGPNGPLKDKKFAGGEIIKHEDFTAVVANITPDSETGIGNWTDSQIITAIREGRRPDGSLLGPAMPSRSYRHLADQDVEAIVAYLRSVPPVYNPITAKSHYDKPLPASWGPPVELSTRRRKRTRWLMAATSPVRSPAAWIVTPSVAPGSRRSSGPAASHFMAPGAFRSRPI